MYVPANGSEWILETAARNGYVTALLDGEFVASKSSIPRVRYLKASHTL